MVTKYTFDLKDDWNYLPSSQEAKYDKKKGPNSFPKTELEGLKYDDLRGLSWAVLEEQQ